MKLFQNLFLLFAVVSVMASCGKKADPSAEKASTFCECAGPAVDMNEKMNAASPEEKQKMLAEYQQVMSKSMECVTAAAAFEKTLSGDALAEYQAKYQAAIEGECPKVAALFKK